MSSTEVMQSTSDLPSGEPVPISNVSIPPPKPLPLNSLIKAAPSNIDAFIAHLHRCLQTPTGIDTVLLFVGYTSRLSASVLQSLTGPAIQRSARQLLAIAEALPPSATLIFSAKTFPSPNVALILRIARRLKALSVLLSDIRTFMRLWGLLNMYLWGRGLVQEWRRSRSQDPAEGKAAKTSTDRVETTVAWAKLVSCVAFQALENGAYLASKGLLDWAPATQGKAARWSARFWGAFVGMELGRLFYESHKRGKRSARERIGNKTVAAAEQEEREWSAAWRKSIVRYLAWAPLTVHWGSEQGLVSEMTIGALGSIPGCIQMRDLWMKTTE